MPFKSDSQRRFLFAKHPDIAKKFTSETPGRRVGRNPTPGVPRKVGPVDVEEKKKRTFVDVPEGVSVTEHPKGKGATNRFRTRPGVNPNVPESRKVRRKRKLTPRQKALMLRLAKNRKNP